MLGPHYQRLAEIEQHMTAKQMMDKIKSRPDNPLTRVMDKLKREFSQYQTAYSDPLMDLVITNLDRLLSFDSKLGPILDALQKENQMLRKQLGIFESQLSNTVGICEQILSENNELKLIVKGKNDDILKLIDTVALNQAQETDQLQQKNQLFSRENSLLLRHLQKLRSQHQEQMESFEQGRQEISQLNRKMDEAKKQVSECLNRERELSRKLALAEQNIYRLNDEGYNLQKQKEKLTFEKNQLNNQVLLLQQRAPVSQDILKKQVEQQYAPIIEEHRQFQKDRAHYLRQNQKLKLENQQLEGQVLRLQQELEKANQDLELTTNLLTQKKTQIVTVTRHVQQLQGKYGEVNEDLVKLKVQHETQQDQGMRREKRLLEQIEQARRDQQELRSQAERKMKEIKESMQHLLDTKEVELRVLREDNNRLQRLVDRQ